MKKHFNDNEHYKHKHPKENLFSWKHKITDVEGQKEEKLGEILMIKVDIF